MGNEQSHGGKQIVINEQQIAKLPYNVGDLSEVTLMNLDKNLFKKLPTDLQSLVVLSMQYNELSEDTTDVVNAISSFKKLQSLDISNNLFSLYPEGFNALHGLRKLVMNNNKVMDFNMCYPKLEYLDISQNQLQRLPPLPNTIKELHIGFNHFDKIELMHQKLTVLKISLCDIKEIGVFNLPSLQELDLSRNKLTKYPDFVKCTPNLKILHLSDNFCPEIPKLPNTITQFFFCYNNCLFIPDHIANLPKLKHLDVSFNKIKVVKNLPSSLVYFIASENDFETVSLDKLENLEYFFVERNHLTHIPNISMPKLRKMNVSCNELETFESTLPNLEKLLLQFNNLTEIPEWVYKCKNLKIANFNHNKITQISPSFSKSKIKEFSISFNRVLQIPQLSKHIEDLSCSFCGLKTLPSGGENLKKIIAGNNLIEKVPIYPSILEIHLCTNKLTEFPEINDQTITVDVSRNKITQVPLQKIQKLRELDVSYNKISKFEQIKLPYIFSLKIGHNPLSFAFDHTLYPNLNFLDVIATDISFTDEKPPIMNIHVSKNKLKTPHCMLNLTFNWLSFCEMRGTRDTVEDMFVCKANPVDNQACMAIFDGHGGSKTSYYACGVFIKLYTSAKMIFSKQWLRGTMRGISESVKTKLFPDGSTAAVAMFKDRKLITSTIGDSRIIVMTEDGKLKYENRVHKPTQREEFERVHEAGGSVYGFRLQNSLALSRTMGDIAVPGISAESEEDEVNLDEEDRWVIVGCDGVFDELPMSFVGELCKKAKSAIGLSHSLRTAAFAARSQDNITVVALDVKTLYSKVELASDMNSTMRE
ncbi:Leucine Rich Repeat family protein [Trichomonas vaginalis G3]|uniref:Leucine Rich Repeat family protein n=1 Tax=Trichomonas vaginalis (strain ATCC PRA-98 / G3) TaxID=412133 RepID=A2FQF9_TRIV3|nr:uncharacterized protein TVAGG3_0482080 [Trichomonas vaginalis G3]EAX92867.1 Leucine Rich Repeat family protein [Trichomonas vaginalis G3]KAI5515780.1 cAMP biosynthetic process [Trichomonas vaginalis G3]|eukprot:XP_001305797.1 hypothetical protein [Trichomonas vaginalis G3]